MTLKDYHKPWKKAMRKYGYDEGHARQQADLDLFRVIREENPDLSWDEQFAIYKKEKKYLLEFLNET